MTQVLSWAVAIGIPLFGVWLATRWTLKRWNRIDSRVVLVPVLWLLIGVPLLFAIGDPLEEGNWRCLVCNAIEHRVTYRGWILHRERRHDVEETLDTRAFEAWYDREIGIAHEHDWNPIGCHRHPASGSVGCYISTGQAYFAAIPVLPDPAIARTMVDRALRAAPEDRRRMIYDVRLDWPEELFNSIARGATMSREEFDRSYTSWLADHAAWR